MHAVVYGNGPEYLMDMVVSVSWLTGRSHQRSAKKEDFDIPRTQTTYGSRSFCCSCSSTGVESLDGWHYMALRRFLLQETSQDLSVYDCIIPVSTTHAVGLHYVGPSLNVLSDQYNSYWIRTQTANSQVPSLHAVYTFRPTTVTRPILSRWKFNDSDHAECSLVYTYFSVREIIPWLSLSLLAFDDVILQAYLPEFSLWRFFSNITVCYKDSAVMYENISYHKFDLFWTAHFRKRCIFCFVNFSFVHSKSADRNKVK